MYYNILLIQFYCLQCKQCKQYKQCKQCKQNKKEDRNPFYTNISLGLAARRLFIGTLTNRCLVLTYLKLKLKISNSFNVF